MATVYDSSGNPMPFVEVTFTAPSSGASGTFSNGNTAFTDINGQVSETFTANGQSGSYAVTASVNGVSSPATFNLTNT